MKTCPSLEQVYNHALKPAKSKMPVTQTFHVSDAAQHYIRKVFDRFQDGDVRLIERLGEANWQRHQKLRNLPISEHPLTSEHSEIELLRSYFRPASTFRDSALGSSLPAVSIFTPSIASHSSFDSEAEGKHSRLMVPKTPGAVFREESFECEICHTVLHGIRNRIDWK